MSLKWIRSSIELASLMLSFFKDILKTKPFTECLALNFGSQSWRSKTEKNWLGVDTFQDMLVLTAFWYLQIKLENQILKRTLNRHNFGKFNKAKYFRPLLNNCTDICSEVLSLKRMKTFYNLTNCQFLPLCNRKAICVL